MPKNSSLCVTALKPFFSAIFPFDFFGETIINLDDLRTFCANQMMVMAIVALANQFKPRRAVAEIKPLHHVHFLEKVHRTINRRQIAPARRHFGKNFTIRERMRMSAENFKNRRARAGELARLPAQPVFQRGHFLALARMRMCVRLHCDQKITPADLEIKLQIVCNKRRQKAARPLRRRGGGKTTSSAASGGRA